MLVALGIRDMVLIEAAEIDFGPGLNVLTGETGAGKSILLDCLGFVLGWRGRGDLVRSGAARGEVAAEFAVSAGHPAVALMEAAGLPAGETLLLRRSASPDGRRQAFLNDRKVTAETLRAIGDTLVELHGQHDDRGLLDPRGHRALLDAFAGSGPDLDEVAAHWRERGIAATALAAAREALDEGERQIDFARHALGEIEALDPQPGDEATLDARRRELKAAERIRDDVARTAAALGTDGAEGALLQALRWLETAAAGADGRLDAAVDGLGRVLTDLGEVAQDVDAVADGLSGQPGELEAVEERLFALRGLARKHQVAADDLAELALGFRSVLDRHAGATGEIDSLEAAVSTHTAAHAEAAARLSARRSEAAGRLDAQMMQELPPLKLERAVFVTEITPSEPGPDGSDRVRFTVATAPGTPPGPIDRIASGGELSRFLLALKVCLSGGAGDVTMIFDEIDRGVGGATADAVGRRLRALGAEGQVIVVTHSPQVAARGGRHWRVGKTLTAEGARTEVAGLDELARVEEIARMLAGDTVTDEARAAARALLAG